MAVGRHGGGLRLLNDTPVPGTLVTLNVPVVVKVLVGTLCGLISTCFITNLKGDRVNTVSVMFPLKRIIINLNLVFNGKTTSCLSELLKHKSGSATSGITDATLCDDVLVNTVVVLLSAVFLGPVLIVIKTARAVVPCTSACTEVCILSYVFGIFGMAVGGVMDDRNTTGAAVYTLLLKTMLGVKLSPLFVCVLSVKMRNTTVTATVSRVMSALICLACILHGGDMFAFDVGRFSPAERVVTRVLGVKIPALIFRLLADLSVTLVGHTSDGCNSSIVTNVKTIAQVASVKALIIFKFLGKFRPVTKFDCKTGGFSHLHRTVGASVV